jgi:hypothetical protein
MSYWLAILIFAAGACDVGVILYWRWRSPAARASRLEFPFHLLFRREQDPRVERARKAAVVAAALAAIGSNGLLVAAVVFWGFTPWALLLALPSAGFFRQVWRTR